jgi:hypothetical protein
MLTFVGLILWTFSAHANSGGRTGSSVSGCGGCHTTNGSLSPMVVLSAPATSVLTGSSNTITFQVTTYSAAHTAAGMNVSASGGTFAAGTGTQVMSGEVTHLGGIPVDGSKVATFTFDWTAPSTPGSYTLRAAGNAVNLNRAVSGDASQLTQLVMTVTAPCVDVDIDGFTTCAGDCNDGNAEIYPGASERCDGVDQDCDSTVDEDAIDKATWYEDEDSDGYGGLARTELSCTKPSGYAANSTDCDDAASWVHPGAPEVCDPDDVDEDCDDLSDDEDSDVEGGTLFYVDADQDGYGSATSAERCDGGLGWSVVSDDCDDANPLVYVCDGDTDGGDTDGGDTDGGDTDTDTDTGAGLDTDVWSDTEDTDSALDSGPAEDGSATDTDDVASDDVASEGGCGCASGGGMPVHGLFAAGGAVLLAAGRRFRGRRPR